MPYLEGQWFKEASDAALVWMARAVKTIPNTDTFIYFSYFACVSVIYLGYCLVRFKKPSAEASYKTTLPPVLSIFFGVSCATTYYSLHAFAQWGIHNKILSTQQVGAVYSLADASDRMADHFVFLALLIVLYRRRKDLAAEIKEIVPAEAATKMTKSLRPGFFLFFVVVLQMLATAALFGCRHVTTQVVGPDDSSSCIRSQTSGRYGFYLILFSVVIAGIRLYSAARQIAGSQYGKWDREVLPAYLLVLPCIMWLRLWLGADIGARANPTDPWNPTPGMGTLFVRGLAFFAAAGAFLRKQNIRVPATPTEISAFEDAEAQRFAISRNRAQANAAAATVAAVPAPQPSEKEAAKAKEAEPVLILLDEEPAPAYIERAEEQPKLIVFDSDDESDEE